MRGVLHHQLPWFVGGPVLGLCVVAMRWLLNERLGVSGAFSSIVERFTGRRSTVGTGGAFVVGLLVGALVYALIAGGPDFHGYGWLTRTFHGSGRVVVGLILVAAGVLIGFGAKTAGGCTSGNGLTGNAMTSPASAVATATFFGTAIGVSFLIGAVI
jgi:uncharacterized membrane protein YedE/YeeE